MTPASDRGIDRLTLVAIAIVAYALANLIHEGLGHAGTCAAVGGRVTALSAVHAQCAAEDRGFLANALVMAAGTLANLLAGAAAWLLLRRQEARLISWRYFLWLFMTLNLLQGTGYWLFSGMANVGDWAQLVADLEPSWLYRVILAIVGGAGYWWWVVLGFSMLIQALGEQPDQFTRNVYMC